jgi:hypothetical protein
MLPIFSDETILIMDDWNWKTNAFEQFIQDNSLHVLHRKEIFTSGEDPEDFWNGLGVFLIGK